MNSTARQLRTSVPRFAEAAVERARLRVAPRRRPQAPRVPFVTLVSVLLLGGVVGLLCFNTQMQQSSFAATSLDKQAASLTAREQSLQAELQVLSGPQRISDIAKRQGMTVPSGSRFLHLGSGKVTGDAPPAVRGNIPPLEPPAPKLPDWATPKPTTTTGATHTTAGHDANVPGTGTAAE